MGSGELGGLPAAHPGPPHRHGGVGWQDDGWAAWWVVQSPGGGLLTPSGYRDRRSFPSALAGHNPANSSSEPFTCLSRSFIVYMLSEKRIRNWV